jgi:twinkle protein
VDSDNLLARIRYLVRACGCGTIVLDHISIVVSGMEDGDERRLIDNAMTKLRCLVQELDCRLILVSHLKRTGQGDGHEEGAQTRLSQLRGSGSIGQISDIVVGLERDQQSENKNLTTVRILKNRWEGETGESLCLKYDKETGRMTEVQPEFEAASAGQESGFSAF